jgi:hypothetical protein
MNLAEALGVNHVSMRTHHRAAGGKAKEQRSEKGRAAEAHHQ